MDSESQLSIVVQAVDNASGVIAGVQEKITTLDTSVAKAAATIKQMDAATTELSTAQEENNTIIQQNVAVMEQYAAAASGAYDAQNRLMDASIAEAMAAGEDAVAMEGEAVATEEAAVAKDVLGQKMDSIAVRFVAHAILIGSGMLAYQYLKGAVDDAEKANNNFSVAMKKADDASKATQTAIGEALAPAIVTFRDAITGAGDDTDKSSNKTANLTAKYKELGLVVYEAQAYFRMFGLGVQTAMDIVVAGVENGITIFKTFAAEVKAAVTGHADDIATIEARGNAELRANTDALGSILNDNADAMKKLEAQTQGAGFDELFKKFTTGPGSPSKAAEALAQAIDTMKNDYESLTAKVTQDLENLETAHEQKVTSITTKLNSLSQSYNDTTAAASSALTALAEKHTNAMDSINKSIESVQTNINNLNTSYANQGTSNVDSLVKAFAKAQEDVTKLQAAIADPTTSASTKTSDQKQLTEDQAALARNADLAKQYSTQIADFIAEDNKTGLEQAIDSFNLKQKQEALAYNTKLSQYNGEIAALNTKSSAETASYNQEVAHSKALYAEKIQKIGDEFAATEKAFIEEQTEFDAKETALKKIQGDAEAEMQKINSATKDLTIKNVQAEIEIYHQLAAAMDAVNSARSAGAVPTISTAARKMATGGIVDSPTLALIGEDGPEAVVPLDNGQGVRALPAAGAPSAGGSVVVNLYYPQVNSEGNIALIKQQLEQALRPLFLNAKPSYV